MVENTPPPPEPTPLEQVELDHLVEQGIAIQPGNYAAMLALLDMFDQDQEAARLVEDARAKQIPLELVAVHGTQIAVKRAATQARLDAEGRKTQERSAFDKLIGAEQIRATALAKGEDEPFIAAYLTMRYGRFANRYAGERGAKARAILQRALKPYLPSPDLSE